MYLRYVQPRPQRREPAKEDAERDKQIFKRNLSPSTETRLICYQIKKTKLN